MSLNDSLSPHARAKLAVWDYPVSEQFTKLMGRMYVPSTPGEALRMVRNGEFAFIGKRFVINYFITYLTINSKFAFSI